MFRHALITFLRNFKLEKLYSLLNVLILSVGLSASLLIAVWTIDEFSWDQFHNDKERIYQVLGYHAYPTYTEMWQSTPAPLAGALKELPDIEVSYHSSSDAGAMRGDRILFRYQDKASTKKELMPMPKYSMYLHSTYLKAIRPVRFRMSNP